MLKPTSIPLTDKASVVPLRILHVVPAYYPAVRYGGPIRSVHELCASLVRRGHQVSVYTTNMDGDEDSDVPLGEPVLMDGVLVHYFPVRFLRRLFWAPALAKHLRRTIDSYDLLHLHSVFLWPTYIAARTAEQARIPYVMSPRGMLVGDVIRNKSRLVKSAWIRLIERRSLAAAARVHVTAEIEAEELRALDLRLPEIFCVPNGVRWPASHPPLSRGPLADLPRPYALFLSRVNHKKGLDRLISAWRRVPDLTLVIAGNDEENYRPELEDLARRERVTERLRFVGPVSDEHKWALYESAEMFVLPSYSENFGNVVAEAMAMGCPVVVTPEVGLSKLVKHAGAGIVTPGVPEVLARAVTQLHYDEIRRKRCGLAGRRAALEQLSWDGVVARMEAEYGRILGRHR
ncbi:MAG TPA: glycosyltransferase [Steroidobacteraceae bacterium]|jgi:glycosyltransferase involved in cell wall biosynthesis|nr:glycosyltransferase [Steroidobacteraceae bacterium]